MSIFRHSHFNRHAFSNLYGRDREGLTVMGRRSMLKAGLAGMAGLSLPSLLQAKAAVAETGQTPLRQ